LTEVKSAEGAAKDEVWSGYRFVILSDAKAANGLKIIDLGAGHASANQTLSGHIIAALKTEALSTSRSVRVISTGIGPRLSRTAAPGRSPACDRAFSTAP
jgi:hypothetical protein